MLLPAQGDVNAISVGQIFHPNIVKGSLSLSAALPGRKHFVFSDQPAKATF